MEWIFIIIILLMAFIPILYRINKRIYEIEQIVKCLYQLDIFTGTGVPKSELTALEKITKKEC